MSNILVCVVALRFEHFNGFKLQIKKNWAIRIFGNSRFRSACTKTLVPNTDGSENKISDEAQYDASSKTEQVGGRYFHYA